MTGSALGNALRKNCGIKEPKVIITRSWFLSLTFVFIIFILACISAYNLREEDHEQSVAFAAMWTVLLAIGISIAGTVIMRKYQTELAIGGFLGVLVIMTNQMLILFAIFLDSAYNLEDQTAGAIEGYKTMAAFFFLLFADYLLFVILLGTFKSVIISDDFQGDGAVPGSARAADDADFDEMPPINI